ncbi:uncharacterized protein LODBEIA_P53970 [Lodderomyces beijingensis]|uniref:PCI domain-containing protein n=1 Tax=Lodderomyces beijingensis TaxID=1775926 RepID=A0ABP0ZSR7_9ASCO
MDGLQKYIDEFLQVIKDAKTSRKDEEAGKRLAFLLTINPGTDEAARRKNFKIPNEFDIYKVPDKFKQLIVLHLQLIQAIHVNRSFNDAFNLSNELCLALVRASEQQDRWIMPALISSFSEFVTIYQIKNKRQPEDLDSFMIEDGEFDVYSSKKKSNLETVIDTLRRGFHVVFNDKNPDPKQSKRNYVYFFLGNLMKFCFKMGKLDFAKSIMKTVEASKSNLPSMSQNVATRKSAITYLYYMSIIALDNGDYATSEAKLSEAFELIALYNVKTRCSKQVQRLLLYLIPLRLYLYGKLPNDYIKTSSYDEGKRAAVEKDKLWDRFPLLSLLYKDSFIPAIKQGNLLKYNSLIERSQSLLLNTHLFILMQLITQLVQLQLIKKTWQICQECETNHIVSLSAFQMSFVYSSYYDESYYGPGCEGQDSFKIESFINSISILEVETIIANLIGQGKINAYISHSQQCIVFSKTNPFPGFGLGKKVGGVATTKNVNASSERKTIGKK